MASGTKTGKAMTKNELKNRLATQTGLTAKQIGGVLDALATTAASEAKKNGSFNIPDIAKIVVLKKPATKARQGINPFTKEPMTFAAKPARKVVRLRPVKALKQSVS